MVTLDSVLIIGGCGFLGHHIVKRLIQRQTVRVSVLDVNSSRNRFPGATYYEGNICSRRDIDTVLHKENPQVIIHTASPTAQDQLGLEVYTRVNIEGTKTILEAASAHPSVRAIVYTSSAAVVFDFVSDLYDADESFPILEMPDQFDAYAHTKGVADRLVRQANRPGTLLSCCLRVSGMFGARDLGVTSAFIENSKTGKARFQIGDGKNLCDWTYVENIVDAHLLAAEALQHEASVRNPEHRAVAGEAFFITNDEPRSFWQFARDLGSAAGYPTRADSIWVIPKSVGLTIAGVVDWIIWVFSFGQRQAKVGRYALNLSCLGRTYRIDKAKALLGYKPQISLDDGIRLTGLWWKDEVEGKKESY